MKHWAFLLFLFIAAATKAQTGGVWKPMPEGSEPTKNDAPKESPNKPRHTLIKDSTTKKKGNTLVTGKPSATYVKDKDQHKKKDAPPVDTLNTVDSSFVAGKVMVRLSIDVSCDEPIHNCDSIQALRDPCFREYLEYKHNQEDCQTGHTDCTIQIRALPLVVSPVDIKPHHTKADRLWIFLLLTFQFIVVVYIRVAFYKSMEDSIKAYFNINLSQQLYREQEPSQPFSAFLLNVNFIISMSLFTYLLVLYFLHPSINPLLLLTEIIGGISGLYMGKYLLMRFIGAIFPFKEEIDFYAFNFFLNQKLLGVLLIPFNFIIAYSPTSLTGPMIYVSVILLVATLIMRSFRGLMIARNYLALYKFHFFVYICTLEIAPMAIILKLIIRGLH